MHSSIPKSEATTAIALTPKASAFVDACSSRKGQFISLDFKSEPAPSAEFKKAGVVLEKISKGIYRTGINFANLSAVKEGIENGERGEVQPLPKGQSWAIFPLVIKKEDGSLLLRVTMAEGHFPQVTYKVNGSEVSKENFESYLPPSARSSNKERPLVFTIKESNLLAVAGIETP